MKTDPAQRVLYASLPCALLSQVLGVEYTFGFHKSICGQVFKPTKANTRRLGQARFPAPDFSVSPNYFIALFGLFDWLGRLFKL